MVVEIKSLANSPDYCFKEFYPNKDKEVVLALKEVYGDFFDPESERYSSVIEIDHIIKKSITQNRFKELVEESASSNC